MGYRKTPHFQDQLELRGIDEMLVSLCIAKGRRHDARMRQKGVLALRLDHRQIVEAVLAGYVDPGNLGGVTAMFVVIKGQVADHGLFLPGRLGNWMLTGGRFIVV